MGRLVVSRTHERDRTRVTSSPRPRECEVGWLDDQELTVLSQYQQKPISQSRGPTAMHDPPHYILILLCLYPPLLEQRLRKGTLLQWGPALSKLCSQTHHGIIATLHAYLYIRPTCGPGPLKSHPGACSCGVVACLDTDTYVVDVQATSDGSGRMRLSISEMEWDF